MRTKLILGLLCLAGVSLSAQNVISNASLTIGGLEAGFMGQAAGTTPTKSVFYGYRAGYTIADPAARGNTFIGHMSGTATTNGGVNTFLGGQTGLANTTGSGNTFLGHNAGSGNTTGYSNIFIGNASASNNTTGNGNIIIGNASATTTTSDQLAIDASNTATPLIWGDFAADLLKLNGKVGIGGVTTFPTTAGGVSVSAYKLFVKGGVLTEEVRVSASTGWADYVFAKDYKLPTLEEVEKHIAEKGHLINVPSARQIESDGIALGEMAKTQQEKIEELTLYIIEQNKINTQQAKEIAEMKKLLQQILDNK